MLALKKCTLFVLIALSFASCKILQPNVSVVPAYDAAILQDKVDLGKQVDLMYISMEAAEEKGYENYGPDYANGEMLINSIILRDEARRNGKYLVTQDVKYRDLFLKYQGEHKSKSMLNDSEIRIYKRYLADALKAILVAETSLK